MTILLLKGYNNYFNRIVKIENDISNYKTASTSYLEYANVNFDPQDGILTSLVVGSEGQLDNGEILQFDSLGSPDYLIVHEGLTINSRWFVVESVKTTAGQYKLALKRDVLADFREQVMNSPCYVEKGSITDLSDPLLLNSEGMSFNQIKQQEIPLRDNTNCAWLVGYLKKDLGATELDSLMPISYAPSTEVSIALTNIIDPACVTFQSTTTTQATKKPCKINKSESTVKFRTAWPCISQWSGIVTQNIRSTFSMNNTLVSNNYYNPNTDWQSLNSVAMQLEYHGPTIGPAKYITVKEGQRLGQEIFEHTVNWGYVNNYYQIMLNTAKYNVITSKNYIEAPEDIMSYNNKTVFYDNKYWTLVVGSGSSFTEEQFFTGEDGVANDYFSNLYYEFKNHFQLYRNPGNPGKKKVRITFKGTEYTITAIEQPAAGVSYTLPYSINRRNCSDAQYDMFCMPIDPTVLGVEVGATNTRIATGFMTLTTVSKLTEYNLAIATALCTKLGAGSDAGFIYDLQVLPYCPMSLHTYNTYTAEGAFIGANIDISSLTSKDFEWIVDGQNNKKGIIFYPSKANKTTDIKVNMDSGDYHIDYDTEITIKDPVFHTEVTDWPNPGDIARDEEGNPLLYYTMPYKAATYWDDPKVYNAITEIPQEVDNYLAEDGVGVNLIVSGSDGTVTIYFSYDRAETSSLKPSQVFQGDLKVQLDWIIPDNAIEKKVKNECNFCRLVSPNYNGMFEFKQTKLSEFTIINVDLTFKPYTPYIKLNPNFDGSLYMAKDFNDSTGLLCAGDFSLPMVNDAFTQYELQNRNYQAIFARNIQQLDVNNKIAREQLDYQGLIGTIGGGVAGSAQGLSTGMKTGNPYVAAAMAVVGGVAGNALGGIGWAKDRDWLERQQNEARSFTIDQYQYSLGNVQALPQSITKSSPLSFNNKIWPILELYSCKDREKEVLRNKIKYNGMTIMAIGTLQDYAQPGGYLKGQMIRINNLNDDSHIAQAIYEEVNKGFYEGENE